MRKLDCPCNVIGKTYRRLSNILKHLTHLCPKQEDVDSRLCPKHCFPQKVAQHYLLLAVVLRHQYSCRKMQPINMLTSVKLCLP